MAKDEEMAISNQKDSGILYLCATPIGNMEDITIRVLNVLRSADLVAAEDTRRTRKILSRYHIKNKLISYHQHNQTEKGMHLIALLKEGKNIALTSDAGTPGISDPGSELVKAAIREGIRVESLPGPAAFLVALITSGMNTDRFVFEGFLPRKKSKRQEAIRKLSDESRTIILYESPHRIQALLQEISTYMGERQIALCRELTKKFEEILRGRASDLIAIVAENPPRGEYTIVIDGHPPKEADKQSMKNGLLEEPEDIENLLRSFIEKGMTKRDAVQEVVMKTGLKKKDVYAISLKIEN